MAKWVVGVETEVTIEVKDGHQAMERVTSPDGDDWRSFFYDLRTEKDVLEHWAYNAVASGVEDASRLDGWADLGKGVVTMRVDRTLGLDLTRL